MRHAGEGRLGREDVLALAREPRNLPDDIVMFGLVLGSPLRRAFGGRGGVQRRGDAHDDVGREQLRAVVGLDRHAVFNLGGADFAHDRVHLERQVDVLGGPVPHEFEFAVRRHKRDDPVRVEPAQLHALVELAVL